MGTYNLLILILLVVVVAMMPRWSYSQNWGYGPSGVVGVILTIIVVLFLLGRV